MNTIISSRKKTLAKKILFSGIGVHSGKPVSLALSPAVAESGIVIKNRLFPDDLITIGTTIPEVAPYATVLRGKNWQVRTIEHVMAAIAFVGIDSLVLETEDDEFPILDGSAAPFIKLINETGFIEYDLKRSFITPKERLLFEDNLHNRRIIIEPPVHSNDLVCTINYTASFEHPLLGTAQVVGAMEDTKWIEHISCARTFGFLEQLPLLQQQGLAYGSSLENTLVIADNKFMNVPRSEQEWACHKVLDLIGDLALLGKPLAGTIYAERTGHAFNRLVVEHYIQNPHAWITL